MLHLRVREPFGDYAKGAVINDKDAIACLHASGQAAQHCVPFDGDADHLREGIADEKQQIAAPEAEG